MPLIDLSAPIRNDPPELPDVLRTEIELSGHDEGAELIQTMFGVGPELLRDGEGWANETFMRFGTHSSTHIDAPWHYNSKIAGRARADDRPAAPRLVLRAGSRDRSNRPRGRRGADQRPTSRSGCRARLAERDIVLVHTGRDAFYDELDYIGRGPGVSAEATALALRAGRAGDGHRRLGLGRAAVHAGRAGEGERREGGLLGRPPGRSPYSQIERLFNLGALPPRASRSPASPCASSAPAPPRRGSSRSSTTDYRVRGLRSGGGRN